MKTIFMLVAENGQEVLDSVQGETASEADRAAALEDARNSAKSLAKKKKERILVLAPVGYAEPIDPPVRWRTL